MGLRLVWCLAALLGLVSHGVLGLLNFKDSPFYRIVSQLTPTIECKGGLSSGKSCNSSMNPL